MGANGQRTGRASDSDAEQVDQTSTPWAFGPKMRKSAAALSGPEIRDGCRRNPPAKRHQAGRPVLAYFRVERVAASRGSTTRSSAVLTSTSGPNFARPPRSIVMHAQSRMLRHRMNQSAERGNETAQRVK